MTTLADNNKPSRTVTWYLNALRKELAMWLRAFQPEAPQGGTVPFEHRFIDDGVDYSLPMSMPQSLLGDDILKAAAAQEADPDRKSAMLENARVIEVARLDYLGKYTASLKEADAVYHFQFDKPYLYYENLSQFPTSDPLREWDWQGTGGWGTGGPRKEILSRCHLAFERNPIANTAVTLTTQFCIGEGLTITYKNKDVQAVLEAFRANTDNAVEEFEKTFLNDLQIDGELFIRFATNDEGETVIYPLKPWEIWWIQANRLIKRRIESFHWVAGVTSGAPGDFDLVIEDILAKDVLFVAINRASYDARGKPELFRILPWLKAYKDWLEGRARQNHWRGAMLWDVTLEGATAQQVAAKRAQYRQPPPPGSMAIHNDKEVWQPLESKSNASDVAEDGRQIKLMSAVGSKKPEYMLSDGENANKATANAQELPALASFADFQDIIVNQVWTPIYKRVIQNAVEAGTLKEEVEEQDADGDPITEPSDATGYVAAGGKGKPKTCKAIDAFSVSAPELMENDPKNLADALTLARNNGWVSDETASGRMGFDYRTEKKKMDAEMKVKSELAYQGGMAPDGTVIPNPMTDFNTDDKPDDDKAGTQNKKEDK